MNGADVDRYFQQLQELERRRPRCADPRRRLARRVEAQIQARLIAAGYLVNPTSHSSRYDLLIDDCLRIEIKAATWRSRLPHNGGGGRYQFRYHNQADILIACCVNFGEREALHHHGMHHYIVPTVELGDRSYMAITSPDPETYDGQWAPYLENWGLIDAAIAHAREGTYQPGLIGAAGVTALTPAGTRCPGAPPSAHRDSQDTQTNAITGGAQ